MITIVPQPSDKVVGQVGEELLDERHGGILERLHRQIRQVGHCLLDELLCALERVSRDVGQCFGDGIHGTGRQQL